MKLPRLSTRRLMALVLGLAFNFALLRQFFLNGGTLGETILGILFMGNILAFGTYRILSHRGESGFNKGFVGFGFAAVIAYLWCLAMFPDTVSLIIRVSLAPFSKLYDGYIVSMLKSSPYKDEFGFAFLIPILYMASATVALPQILFAMLGGWLGRKRKAVRHDPTLDLAQGV